MEVFAQFGGILSEEYSISVQAKSTVLPTQPGGGGGYTAPSQDIKDSGTVTEEGGEVEEEELPAEA